MAPSSKQMFDLLMERLTANRRMLQAAAQSKELDTISERQRSVFMKALHILPKLSAMDATRLVEQVVIVGWKDVDAVVKLINEKADHHDESLGSLFSRDSKYQDFATVEHFLPDEVWEGESGSFLVHVCEFVSTRLGCISPTVFIFRKIAALALLKSQGREGAAVASYHTKTATMILVKKEMTKYKTVLPKEWIARLPPSPADMKVKYSRQYEHAYRDFPPAPCRFADFDTMVVDSTIPCRDSALRVCQHGLAPNALQLQCMPQNNVLNGFGQFGQAGAGNGFGQFGQAGAGILQVLQHIANTQVSMQELMVAKSPNDGVDLPGFRYRQSTSPKGGLPGGFHVPPPVRDAMHMPPVMAPIADVADKIDLPNNFADKGDLPVPQPNTTEVNKKKKTVEEASDELQALMGGGGCDRVASLRKRPAAAAKVGKQPKVKSVSATVKGKQADWSQKGVYGFEDILKI
jgi:hypothetical protein